MVRERKMRSSIALPFKLSLTEEAVSRVFSGNRKLKRVHMADSSERYGFEGQQYDPRFVGKLIRAGLLSEIEVAESALFERRHEILELTGAIVQTILCEKFGREMQSVVFSRPEVKYWNRHNPHKIVDDRTKLKRSAVQAFLAQHSSAVTRIKMRLLKPMHEQMAEQKHRTDEDWQSRTHLWTDFVDHIPPEAWYIAITLCGGAENEAFIAACRTLMSRYMLESDMIDYIGLIVVELVGYLENTMLARAAQAIEPEVAFGALVRNDRLLDEARSHVVQSGRRQAVSWEITPNATSFEHRTRLQIMIYSTDMEFGHTLEKFNEHRTHQASDAPLKRFLATVDSDVIDGELGLHYLSYLTNCCSDLGILFDASVSQIVRQSHTSVSLLFHF